MHSEESFAEPFLQKSHKFNLCSTGPCEVYFICQQYGQSLDGSPHSPEYVHSVLIMFQGLNLTIRCSCVSTSSIIWILRTSTQEAQLMAEEKCNTMEEEVRPLPDSGVIIWICWLKLDSSLLHNFCALDACLEHVQIQGHNESDRSCEEGPCLSMLFQKSRAWHKLLFEIESEQVVIYEVWLLIILKFVENVL